MLDSSLNVIGEPETLQPPTWMLSLTYLTVTKRKIMNYILFLYGSSKKILVTLIKENLILLKLRLDPLL